MAKKDNGEYKSVANLKWMEQFLTPEKLKFLPVQQVRPTDDTLFSAYQLYTLLRSTFEKEGMWL